MIHVCFSLYDGEGHYSKFIGKTILSIFENTNSEVMIHILHDNTLTDNNRNKFSYIVKQYHQFVEFYNVEKLCEEEISFIKRILPNSYVAHFTVGMFYRFFIARVLSIKIKKVIYLDADIIVNLDINELWQVELREKPLGAIPNHFQITDEKISIERTMRVAQICKEGFVNPIDYFNSGVLLINLSFMRNADTTLRNGIRFIGDHPQFVFLDQDILNYCFSNVFLKLPVNFNRYVFLARNENEMIIKKMIYHYAGGRFGIGFDMNDPFNRLWWSYFIKTPWFDVDTMNRIIRGATDTMLKCSDVPHDRVRVFITDEEHAYQIEKNFSVQEEEQVIVIDNYNNNNLQPLIDLMENLKGDKVFFVGIPNIDSELRKMKFVEGTDFFNVSSFCSPLWVNLASTYNLILSM